MAKNRRARAAQFWSAVEEKEGKQKEKKGTLQMGHPKVAYYTVARKGLSWMNEAT